MHKLIYKFEDGQVITTLTEAEQYRDSGKGHWETDFIEIDPLPTEEVCGGEITDWVKSEYIREIPGLKQVDTGNLAKRGYFRTSRKDVLEQTKKYYSYLWEREEGMEELEEATA